MCVRVCASVRLCQTCRCATMMTTMTTIDIWAIISIYLSIYLPIYIYLCLAISVPSIRHPPLISTCLPTLAQTRETMNTGLEKIQRQCCLFNVTTSPKQKASSRVKHNTKSIHLLDYDVYSSPARQERERESQRTRLH